MNAVAWFCAAVAIYIQALNALLMFRSRTGRPSSQITLVPCILWYVGVQIRQRGFFMESGGVEFLLAVVIHLVLSIVLGKVGRSRPAQGSSEP